MPPATLPQPRAWMACDLASVSAVSTGKGSSGSGILSNEPTEIDGTIFMKIRMCPASGVKNCDPNPVKTGKWGPEASKYAMWNKGTSVSPQGRYERISVLTWKHGGFADDIPDIDQFVEKMRQSKSLATEFKAAYSEMVKIIEEGRSRFRGSEQGKAALRMQEVRKQVVAAFKKSQLEVISKFRAVEVSKYEAQNPGRIKAKGMKTASVTADGELKECVLIPKLPEGEYDVEAKDITGTSHIEEHDDGQDIISKRQQASKFSALANMTMGGARNCAVNRALEEQAQVEEAEQVRGQSDAENPDDSSVDNDSPTTSVDDDDLRFIRGSLFASECQRVAPVSESGRRPAPKSSPAHATASSTKRTGSTCGRPQAPSTTGVGQGVATTAPSEGSSNSKRSKFDGKSAEEILEKHGAPAIISKISSFKQKLSGDAFVSPLGGPKFVTAMPELKALAFTAQKSAVALDIKVKKWSLIPERVKELTSKLREQTTVMLDVSRAFLPDKRGGQPDKMLNLLTEISNLGWSVPLAFQGMYLREQVLDHLRFHQIDDIVALCNLQDGFFSGLSDKGVAECAIIELVSQVMQIMHCGLPVPLDDAAKEAIDRMATFAGKLADLGQLSSAQQDLRLLATALQYENTDAAQQQQAWEEITSLADKSDAYYGVLKGVLAEKEKLSVLEDWVCRGAQVDREHGVLGALEEAFGGVNKGRLADRDSTALLNALYSALLVLAANDKSKIAGGVHRILAALAELMRGLPSKVDQLIVQACTIGVEAGAGALGKLDAVGVEASGMLCDVPLHEVSGKLTKDELARLQMHSKVAMALSAMDSLHESATPMVRVFRDLVNVLTKHLKSTESPEENCDSSILEGMAQIKERCLNAPAMSQAARHSLAEFEKAMSLNSRGSKLYKTKMVPFKAAVAALVDSFGTSAPGEGESVVQDVKLKVHPMMQAAMWSDTPDFDRSCVSFAAEVMAVIVEQAPTIRDPQSHGKRIFPASLRAAFGQLAQLDTCKPKLQWLLESSAADKFLDNAKDMQKLWESEQEAQASNLLKDLRSSLAALSALLVEEAEGASLMGFADKLSQPKADKIKQLRQKIKELQGEMNSETHDSFPTLDKTLELAKHQSFKWGVARFVAHPEIRVVSSTGNMLRKNLADIWSLESMDTSFKAYLGKAAEQEVEEILLITPKAKKTKASAGTATDTPSKRARTGKNGVACSMP